MTKVQWRYLFNHKKHHSCHQKHQHGSEGLPTFVLDMNEGKKIPNYSIDGVGGRSQDGDGLMAMRFGEYLATRNYLFRPHRHSFYHMVFFAKGEGRHSIDFIHYPVRPGQIYFMNPGQVHNWEFEGDVDGYIVNFTARHFQMMLASAAYLERFAFFSGRSAEQVIDLPEDVRAGVEGLLERLVAEVGGTAMHAGGNGAVADARVGYTGGRALHSDDMVIALLIQLFVTVSRQQDGLESGGGAKPGTLVMRNFRRLIEEHFMTKRLPKDYAAMLYVTPNYLNALCKDILGVAAGEVIRERVLLEAKRLLVNGGLNITEIAYQLNFQDNSYFSKFFRKYTGTTPEEFRRLYHVTVHNQ